MAPSTMTTEKCPRTALTAGGWPILDERTDMAKRMCSVEGCDRPAIARGWCSPHWTRWSKTGDVQADVPIVRKLRLPPAERFWQYVDRRGADECWPWTGHTIAGYGQFRTAGKGSKQVQAHRFGYELLVGPISDELTLDHQCHDSAVCRLGTKCPHRLCCNPAHVLPATRGDNARRGWSWKAEQKRLRDGQR